MNKAIYLTTNKGKFEEAKRIFKNYDIEIEVVNPNFDIPEIQANNCGDVASFSVKYACEKLKVACVKSDTGLYLDCLGGLPGPYNAFFCNQIKTEHFLELIKNEKNRTAYLEDAFAYCEPGEEPIVFIGRQKGKISYEARGTIGKWHDFFFIPDGEEKTLSELREINPEYESKFWGNAKFKFASWYKKNKNSDKRKVII